MKTEITVEQAISDLRELFGLDNPESGSIQTDNTFMIIKTEYERFQVIDMLTKYFNDKMLPPGWGCKIDNITLLWTSFSFIQL